MKPRKDAVDHKRIIGIKQAQRTIAKILRRQRLGTERPTDKQALINARVILNKWETKS